jgi:uncharacterized membrane protein
MIKRLTAWTAVGVALALAVQWLQRDGSPAPAVVPPTIERSVDVPVAERALPQAAEPAPLEQRADVAVEDEPPEPASRTAVAAADAPELSRRFVFDCGNGVLFSVRTTPGEATLFSPRALGGEVVTLPQVRAASGAHYAEGGVSYWNKGGLATFEIRERLYADCTSSPGAAETAEARRRGAVFRARGNEPSWLLEISQERIELATELGTRRVDFPYRVPTVSGTRTTYRSFVGTQELVVVIDAIRCNDSMSGEPFESSVAVTFENDTLYGCGQTP